MSNARSSTAVIYCRVSSTKQVREGDGLASQETRCREFASHRGYEVLEVFRDDISGGSATRPGMQALIAWLRKNRGSLVVIDDISRLARGVKAHMELRAAISLAGGILVSPSVEFGDDADSELQEYILATVAQHQRRKNAEQTRNRMRARAMNGYWVTPAPIGYRYEKVAGHGKMLVRDEPYATILAEALNGYACGRFETQVEVKRFLESQPAWPKDRKGEVHQQRVTEFFSRPVYAGVIHMEEWGLSYLPAKHEGLITLATFMRIHDRRNGVAKAPTRKSLNEDFPLRGFVLCGTCNEPLTACWSKGRSKAYPYYLCDTKGCPDYRKSVRKERIEGEFETLLSSLEPTATLFDTAHAMIRDIWDARLADVRKGAAALVQEIKGIEAKVEQLLDRVVEATGSALVSAYEKRIRDLEARKAVLKERIASSGKPLTPFEQTYRTAFEFLASPCKLWHSPRIEDQRAVLRLVFAQRLAYDRREGYRTAETSMPFKLLGTLEKQEKGMVGPAGLEPATRPL